MCTYLEINIWIFLVKQWIIVDSIFWYIWSTHQMVSRILFSRILIFFHQICFLFWSPQNEFLFDKKQKFRICENKIRETISWGHHTSWFRKIYLILSSLCESFSRSLSHLSISFSIWETACFCNATLVIFPSIHCHFFFALFVFSFWFLTAFGLFRWFWLILLWARLNNDTWKIRHINLRFDKCMYYFF